MVGGWGPALQHLLPTCKEVLSGASCSKGDFGEATNDIHYQKWFLVGTGRRRVAPAPGSHDGPA